MRTGPAFGAVLLIVMGVIFLLGNLNIFVLRWDMLGPLFLILVGGWMIARAVMPRGQHGDQTFGGIGEYHLDLAGKEIRREKFSHGIGEARIDLTRAVFPDGENKVEASHGVGELRVIVPSDLAVRVRANAGMGEVRVFDEQESGIDPHLEFQSPDYASATRKLDLLASAGLGAVLVKRA